MKTRLKRCLKTKERRGILKHLNSIGFSEKQWLGISEFMKNFFDEILKNNV
jgi:hypothetical protein